MTVEREPGEVTDMTLGIPGPEDPMPEDDDYDDFFDEDDEEDDDPEDDDDGTKYRPEGDGPDAA